MLKIFPNARYLLVEPLRQHTVALEQLVKTNPNLQYIQRIVSSKNCPMKIHCHGHQSSLFGNSFGEPFGEIDEVEAQPLDSLLTSIDSSFPDMIKLDIQGAELEVLRGASLTLQRAQFVQL